MKLDVDGLLNHNIPLKDVIKVDILNRMYSDPQKNRKCCDNLIKKDRKNFFYIDNDVHANIDPKLQNMSKIQLLRRIFHEGVRKNIQGSFVEFQKNFTSSILIRAIIRKIGCIWK